MDRIFDVMCSACAFYTRRRVPNTPRTTALSTLLVVSFLAALVASSHARADAIGPPLVDCPRGAEGENSHSGRWCRPTTCTRNTCSSEQTCEPQGLCVTTETYTPGGRPIAADQPREPRGREIAVSACNAGDTCANASPCVVANRCVRASLADAFQPKNAGCGCAPAGRASSAAGMCVALAGVAALLVARGKRRR